jgi:hydrogenase maturation protease
LNLIFQGDFIRGIDGVPKKSQDFLGRYLSPLCVIGLGNILLRDEGVGVHAANTIKQRYTFSPNVEIIDGGTIGLDLLPIFEGRDKVLIVDAVDFGREPGYVGIIENDDIPSVLNSKLSVHHINLSDVLFAAKLMDISPPEICLIGIQPQSLDVGLDMTDEIKGKIEILIDVVIGKLKEWNVECALLSHQKSFS